MAVGSSPVRKLPYPRGDGYFVWGSIFIANNYHWPQNRKIQTTLGSKIIPYFSFVNFIFLYKRLVYIALYSLCSLLPVLKFTFLYICVCVCVCDSTAVVRLGLLIVWGFEITLGHTTLFRTPGSRLNAETSASQHSQETDIHAPGGIRKYTPNKRAAVDPRLRPHGHWDRPQNAVGVWYFIIPSQLRIQLRTLYLAVWELCVILVMTGWG